MLIIIIIRALGLRKRKVGTPHGHHLISVTLAFCAYLAYIVHGHGLLVYKYAFTSPTFLTFYNKFHRAKYKTQNTKRKAKRYKTQNTKQAVFTNTLISTMNSFSTTLYLALFILLTAQDTPIAGNRMLIGIVTCLILVDIVLSRLQRHVVAHRCKLPPYQTTVMEEGSESVGGSDLGSKEGKGNATIADLQTTDSVIEANQTKQQSDSPTAITADKSEPVSEIKEAITEDLVYSVTVADPDVYDSLEAEATTPTNLDSPTTVTTDRSESISEIPGISKATTVDSAAVVNPAIYDVDCLGAKVEATDSLIDID